MGLPREPKPWKFLGFPNSLYRDVIKDPGVFQGLGSPGRVYGGLRLGFRVSVLGLRV